MDSRRLIRLAVVAHGFLGGFVEGHGSLHELIGQEDLRVAAHPGDASILLNRAHLLRLHGEFDRARADLEKVEVLAPDMPARLLVEAGIYGDQGENGAANKALDAYLAMVPGDAEAHALRSSVHESMGDEAASIDDARKVIELRGPSRLGDHLRLIHVLRNAGKMGEVRAAYQAARVSQGPVPSLLTSEAEWLAECGEQNAAAMIYAELRQRVPSLAFHLWVEEARMWSGHDVERTRKARAAAGREWESLSAKMRSRSAILNKYQELQAITD